MTEQEYNTAIEVLYKAAKHQGVFSDHVSELFEALATEYARTTLTTIIREKAFEAEYGPIYKKLDHPAF